MAPTLLGIVVTIISGQAWSGPVLPVSAMEALVTRSVNGDAAALAVARGFRPGRPFVVRVLDRPHLAAEREAAMRSARSPGVAAAESRMLALMGLAGRRAADDTDAEKSSPVDVTGFYDPVSKRILVGNWAGFEGGRAARLKDIAEGLLDRRFGLAGERPGERPRRGREPARENAAEGDALWARLALFEGDATVQTLERLSPDGALTPTPTLAVEVEGVRQIVDAEDQTTAPLELAHRLFVALDGSTFVAGVRARAPWATVNQLWARPPASTEQVLHPDKYERHESPDDVDAHWISRRAGARTQDEVVYSDTLGELGARAFLRRAVGDYRAERGAAGWGGDRVRLLRGPETGGGAAPEFVTWVTTWDDVSDAQDFAEQAVLALGSLAGATLTEVEPASRRARVAHAPRRWRSVDAQGRTFALDCQNRAVTLLIGAPESAERSLSALTTAVSSLRRSAH